MNRLIGIFSVFILLIVFTGCNLPKQSGTAQEPYSSDLSQNQQAEFASSIESSSLVESSSSAQSSSTAQPSLHVEQSKQSENSQDLSNSVTPHQYINLMAGNADELSFTYKKHLHEVNRTENGAFYKEGERIAEIFTTEDETGKPITVRELESEGTVKYILDHNKKIRRYLAPSDNFLLYKMMKVLNNTLNNSYTENDGIWYKYLVAYEQDDSVVLCYCFYMKNGSLEKMTYSVDDFLSESYEFSKFSQEVNDQKVFNIPSDYNQEVFNSVFNHVAIPPWWENDGL